MRYLHLFIVVSILVLSACSSATSTPAADQQPAKNQEFLVNFVEVDDIDPSEKVLPALMVSVEGFQNGSEVRVTPLQGGEISFIWNGAAPTYVEYAGMMSDYARINTVVVINRVLYKVEVEEIGTKVVKLHLIPKDQ